MVAAKAVRIYGGQGRHSFLASAVFRYGLWPLFRRIFNSAMKSLQDHRFIPKSSLLLQTPPSQLPLSIPIHVSVQNSNLFARIPSSRSPNPLQKQCPTRKMAFFAKGPGAAAAVASDCSNSVLLNDPSKKNANIMRLQASRPQAVKKFSSSASHCTNSLGFHIFCQTVSRNFASFLRVPSFQAVSPRKLASFCTLSALSHSLALSATLSFAFPTYAAVVEEEVTQKINIEEILVSIDDFFSRNPFFVAGVTFIWLVVIPLTEEYLKKYKFISAIDAFRKLRDAADAQLLDIRKRQSVNYMDSPNLKIINKRTVQMEFSEGNEEEFVKEVVKSFSDPGNTVICILDNFDGNSLKVAELLYKNGFKEAYAIKGGLRGKDGWQEIQETLLPPSVHVYPRKRKRKGSVKSEENDLTADKQESENGQLPVPLKEQITVSEVKVKAERSLSPYPNYPDLKPPSSPTPSKPQF